MADPIEMAYRHARTFALWMWGGIIVMCIVGLTLLGAAMWRMP